MSEMRVNVLKRLIKDACDKISDIHSDDRGYMPRPEDNLISGVRLDQFKADLEQGAGKELDWKFCAVHSSCALGVNTFAPFKDRPGDLELLGKTGFGPPSFEHKLTSGLKGVPPTLDVLLRRDDEVVAVESKFLEYFTAKKAKFSPSYNRFSLPWIEDCWWNVLKDAKAADKRHLDLAQIVKHYLGIKKLLNREEPSGWKPRKATLFYLFWEPDNARDEKICRLHRNELNEFADRVSGSIVNFKWLSYPELWESWSNNPLLFKHARNLRQRYTIRVSS